MDAELKSGLAPTARFCRGFVPAGDGGVWQFAGHAGSRPGGRGTFSLLRQRKVPKRKASRTAKHPTSEYQNPLPQCTSTRLRASLFDPCLLNFGSLNFGLLVLRTSPCGRAEQRSGGRIRAGVCLSPQGEFSPTPLDASSARNRAAALTSARLLLLTFLGEARKVSALSGAYPDNAPLASATPETAPFKC